MYTHVRVAAVALALLLSSPAAAAASSCSDATSPTTSTSTAAVHVPPHAVEDDADRSSTTVNSTPRAVSLRSATQAVHFCRGPGPADGFLLCSSEVYVPPAEGSGNGSAGRWETLFDQPTPIVGGSAWQLVPSTFSITRNDSQQSCVNFSGTSIAVDFRTRIATCYQYH